MKTLASLAALWLAPHVAALEPRDGYGLDVRIEAIAEPIEVDGLSLLIQRATGPDVDKLARRVSDSWRAAGSSVQQLSDGGWQMVSRWQGKHTELLQWRGAGPAAELLYSRLDAYRVTAPPRFAELPLPARCAWGRQIAGRAGSNRYQQRTALCRGTTAAVVPELQALLAGDGWQWRLAAAGVMEVSRGPVQGLVVLGTGPGKAQCWLTWVGHEPASGAGR